MEYVPLNSLQIETYGDVGQHLFTRLRNFRGSDESTSSVVGSLDELWVDGVTTAETWGA